jgi:hypothetical protein
MMAGSLRVESARARGTIVSCWFPRAVLVETCRS